NTRMLQTAQKNGTRPLVFIILGVPNKFKYLNKHIITFCYTIKEDKEIKTVNKCRLDN
ncbi:hypothetical protein BDA99DRAFT_523331, partial [Phascolomyces articulosus]